LQYPPRPSQTSGPLSTLPPGLVLVIDEIEPRFNVVRLDEFGNQIRHGGGKGG
jgi:hypothetical protein